MTTPRKSRDPKTLRPATQLIHGGSLRSRFEETSEALFLTQGYLYDTMEIAEARFKGDDPGFVYSRFSQPDGCDVRGRMALIEGRRGGAGDGERHGGGHRRAMGQLKAGDHVVAAPGAVRLVPLRGRGAVAALRRRPRPWSTGADLDAWRAALRPQHQGGAFCESADQSDAGDRRHRRRRRDHARAGGTLVVDNVFATPLLQHPMKLGADCVVYSATKHIDGQGRVLGGVILASRKVHRRPHS